MIPLRAYVAVSLLTVLSVWLLAAAYWAVMPR